MASWADAMRASSPNRLRSSDSFPENGIARIPSAMSVFEDIVNSAMEKKIVMFLDYDGTLSEIVDDPDKACMTDEMRKALREVARCFPTAIVTGRSVDKIKRFVNLAGIYYAGSHGMDIVGPGYNNVEGVFQPKNQFSPMIDGVYEILKKKTKSIPGIRVEKNKFCLSVHYRCVEEKRWDALAEQVELVLNNYPAMKLTHGRKVFEIGPKIDWDKGKAVEYLLEALGFGDSNDILPIYIGDDRADEDAFKVLRERGQGFGILVSKVPKETSAFYTLKEPFEVKEFLQRLVRWKNQTP